MRKIMIGAAMSALALCTAYAGDYPYTPAPLTKVTVNGGFWLPRFETNRLVTVRADFQKCKETKRLANFAEVAKRGRFSGTPWNDSDVYKVIEGAAYTLATHPDAELEKFLDNLIADIAKAQEPDGYLYCARTLGFTFGRKHGRANYGMMGPTRWSNCQSSHELYNVGHLYEAAVAYFETTGKRTLLEVAIRNADLLERTFGFGPTQLKLPPGHEEVEVGLCKLYRVTGEKRYLDLAKRFLDLRGRKDVRDRLWGVGVQDHLPVLQQREALGHAVRAGYLYMGMVDVATLADDPSYMQAIGILWENVVGKKLHLNGGIGASRHVVYRDRSLGDAHEAFGDNYDLPNENAYLETCAAIANALWNERMFLSYGDAKYIDVLERVIYNGFLSGISISGDEFFYPNPLASKGGYARSKWFGCSCCPVNVVRFIPQIAQFAYATKDDEAYVNLYLDSTATLKLRGGEVKLTQHTDYPYDGKVKITVGGFVAADNELRNGMVGSRVPRDRTERFTLNLRVPGWCIGKPVPSDLYTQVVPGTEADYTVKVNGQPFAFKAEKGYCRIAREWKDGDVVEVAMNMPVRRIRAHEAVTQDRGRLAVERGPLMYCAEGVDNGGKVLNAALASNAQFTLDEITIAATKMTSLKSGTLTLIPYFAWCHRGAGEMQSWFVANEK